MEGSSNSQNSGMNPNEKLPSPPPQLQPNGGVPSIFLGPSSISMPADGNSSNNQTAERSVWNATGAAEMPRSRSPPNSGGSTDSYKMKTCVSTQCGNNGYENMSTNMAVSGCQPPLQNRVYPPYIQQQQIAVPIRSMHQHHHHHHHHHGIAASCHPHHSQQSAMTVAPHMDRMMHGGSSSIAVAAAAAQQMRSIVMNHYPPNSGAYPHQPTAPSASTFYPQPVAAASGNGPFMEYNHPHNSHHHGIVQYTHQQHQQQHHQRMVNSGAATIAPYRQVPVHHQQKVMNSSQAAVAAYQSAYQQHQYNQYLHHHGMIPSHSHGHPQNGGAVAGVMQQRMLGIPMANLQQQQQQQQQQSYINRSSHHLQHLHPQSHTHGYSSTCQPSLIPNYAGVTQQQQQQQQQQLVNSMPASSSTVASANNTATGQLLDMNNNNCASSKSMGSSTDVPGTKSMSQKTSPETLIVSQKVQHSSMKISTIKLGTASPEKSVKIKATRSVTKLRDRQPRLVVGQKKKSTGTVAGTSSSRKLKSLKALSAAVSTGVTIENLHSSGKRLTSFLVESDGNGDAKRSRKAAKTEDVLINVKKGNGETPPEGIGKNNPSSIEKDESAQDVNRSTPEKYFAEEQNEDEYEPTPDEMQKYLERLNSCHNLNIPSFYACSVFHGKLPKNNNIQSSKDSSGTTPSATAEGTYTRTTTTTTSTVLYHHYNQLQEINFTTFHNWNSAANSAAETEWKNFQDDMAVLETYFPLLTTMEQSELAEKLDTIYTYEGQIKLMNSSSLSSTACSVGGEQLSPPCTCVQNPTSCSCCYNFMTGMIPASIGSPEPCGNLNDQMTCRNNSSFNGDSPQQYAMASGFNHSHPQPHFVSTPLSSRRGYAGGTHFYDEENGYCFKDSSSMRNRIGGARKRSSSYPSRKSGRRSSGSRDHRKSETESFLDELISTANDEKLLKQKNNSGEVAAPEIQCEVDFPSLESSAAVSFSKRQSKKGKGEESLSARDGYMGSSSVTPEESESNTSACSSSPQSTHNTSSEGDFDGGSEITLVGRVANHNVNSKTDHPILLPPTCSHFEHDPGACCTRPEHLWDDFRGDEVISMQSDSFGPTILGGTSCIPVANLNHLISHCTCRRVDAICPSRPPPGFEHLARPAFPIELYDPSLLGNLIGGQLPREVLSSLDSSSLSRKQFEEMEELLLSLTCCEKHAVDKMLCSRKSSISLEGDEANEDHDDDWENLEKAIKTVLNDWTEELDFRKRMQDILFSLNLHDVYGGCCKNAPFEQAEHENINSSFNSSLLSSNQFPVTVGAEEPTSVFPTDCL